MVHLASFWKPEACGQTVLPDRSVLIGQKLVENTKIQKFKCDILSSFQTMLVYQKSSFLTPFMYAKIISFLLMCVHKRLLRGQCVKMRIFLSFQKDFDLLLVGLENREKLKRWWWSSDPKSEVFQCIRDIHEYFLMMRTRRSRSGNTSRYGNLLFQTL